MTKKSTEEKVSKHSTYNKKRKPVLKIEELKNDIEAQEFWVQFKIDLKAVSGNTKQGIKDLFYFGKKEGFFKDKE